MRVNPAALLMLVGMSLTAQGPPWSIEKEAGLGKQLAADVRQRNTAIDSPTVQAYLDSLGRKIAAFIPDTRFPFTFSVIAEDPCRTTHEPVALPGGYIFVPAALFVAAQNENEFAGMLAHAMEHVAQRHGVRKATGGTSATIPLIFMGGWGGSCSEGTAVPRGFLASQRSAELEADALAVQTMARAGFDPKALMRYLERLQGAAPGRDERVAALLAAMEKLPKVTYTVSPGDEFASARQEVRSLTERTVHTKVPPALMRNKQE